VLSGGGRTARVTALATPLPRQLTRRRPPRERTAWIHPGGPGPLEGETNGYPGARKRT